MSRRVEEKKTEGKKVDVEFVVADRKSLNHYCRTVTRCMDNIANNILKMGDALYHIKSDGLFVIEGYKDIYSFASEKFGISKSTCSRYIGLREYFGLESQYSASQMIELLPCVREGWDISAVTPDMSVRQIRQFIKENFRLCSCDVATAIEDTASIPAAKPESFVFCLTEDLMHSPADALNAFYADIRTTVMKAFSKYGAKTVKIVIE